MIAIHGLLTIVLISFRSRYVGERCSKNEEMIWSSGFRSGSRLISSMFIVSRSNRIVILGSAGSLVPKKAKVRLDKTQMSQTRRRTMLRAASEWFTYLPAYSRALYPVSIRSCPRSLTLHSVMVLDGTHRLWQTSENSRNKEATSQVCAAETLRGSKKRLN